MLSHSSPSVTCTDAKVIYLLALFPSMPHNDICTLVNSFMTEHDVTMEEIDDGELVAFVADFIHPQVDRFSFLAQCKCQQELLEQEHERQQELKRRESMQQIWESSKSSSCKNKESVQQEEQQEALKQLEDKENGYSTANKNSGNKTNALGNCNVIVETKECTDNACLGEEVEADANDSCLPILSFNTKHTSASTHNVHNYLSSVLLNEFADALFASTNFAALSHLREFNNTIEFFSIDTSEWDQMYLPFITQSPSLCSPCNVKSKEKYKRDVKNSKRSNMHFTNTLPEDVYLPLDEKDEEHLASVEHADNCCDNSERVPIIKWAPVPIRTITPNDRSDNSISSGSNSKCISTENSNSIHDKNLIASNSGGNTINPFAANDNVSIEKKVNTNTNEIETDIINKNITEQVLPTAHEATEYTENYLISVRAHDNANEDNNVQSTSAMKMTQTSPPVESTFTPVVQQNTLPPSVQFAQLIGLGSSPSTNVVSSSYDDDEWTQDGSQETNELIATSTKARHHSSSQYQRITEVQSRRSVSRLSAAFPLCEWVINAKSPNVQEEKEGETVHVHDEKSYQQWSVKRSRWWEVQQQQQKRVWEHYHQQQQRSRRYSRRAQSEQVRRSRSLNQESRQDDVNNTTYNYGKVHNMYNNEQNGLTCSKEEHEQQRRNQDATSSRMVYSMQHYRAQSAEPTYMSKLWSEMDKSNEATEEKRDQNTITTTTSNSLNVNNERDICLGNDNNNEDSDVSINVTRHVEFNYVNTDTKINRNLIGPHSINELTSATKAIIKADEENKYIEVTGHINIGDERVTQEESSNSINDSVVGSADDPNKDADDANSDDNRHSSFDVLEFLETEERRAHCMMNTLFTKGVEFDHRGKCHLAQLIMNKCPAMVDVLQGHSSKLLELFSQLLKGTEVLSAKDEIAIRVPVIGSRKLLAHGSLILSSVEFDTEKSSVTLQKETEVNKNYKNIKKKWKLKLNKSKDTQAESGNTTNTTSEKINNKIKNEKGKSENVDEYKDDSNMCFAFDITITELKTLPMSFAFIDQKNAYRQSHVSPEQAERLRAALLSSESSRSSLTTTATPLPSTQEKVKKWYSSSKHKQKIAMEISGIDNSKSQCNVDKNDASAFLYYDHGVTSGSLNATAHKIHITACASLTLSLTRVMALNISSVHLHIGKIELDTSVGTLNVLCTLLKPIIKRILIRKLKALLQETHYL